MADNRLIDLESIMIKLASPEVILAWSRGEVTKPETINYRTAKPERDGLFCERIFGPQKDWECYCGKYRRIRYKGIICDKCGVEVTRSIVRRERMGHIKLAAPVSHIWFLRGVPSKIGLILNMSISDLEKVIYFAGYVVINIDEKARAQSLEEIEREFKIKSKKLEKNELAKLKEAKDKAKEELRSLRLKQVVSEVEYHRLSLKYGEVFDASIGAESIRKLLTETNLNNLQKEIENELLTASVIQKNKLLRRLRIVRGMIRSGVKPEWMFLTAIPIIPPDLRPMVQLDGGRYATSDLNDLYRRVINRNNRLKKLFELKAPEVITRNEKRMLQEAVDALIDNSIRRGTAPVASQVQRRPLKSLADMLKGKQGRFRQNLLGKRVDYSGRSVIVVGPDLKLGECGLPKKMALELFKPFVIRKIIERELSHNIPGAGKLIEKAPPEIWAILEEAIAGKLVLLNRAPTLHRLGIQAFQPVLVEGDAIQIHPLVTPAFNADFDGDQMAVHLPLTEEAQYEAREIMHSTKNLLKPATGRPIVMPTLDMVLGCFWATSIKENMKGENKIFSSVDDAILAYECGSLDLQAKIKVRIDSAKLNQEIRNKDKNQTIIETSVGRLLFNRILPGDIPFINGETKKDDLEDLVEKIIIRYGNEGAPIFLDNIKKFGFEFATKSGISWGMNDLRFPENKKELIKIAEKEVAEIYKHFHKGLLTDRERYDRVLEVWKKTMDKVREGVPAALDKNGSISAIMRSKAKGAVSQINQMAGMKGLVVNPAGRIIELPVVSSYKEGLNVLEYFISTHGARKGTADTALRTAAAGYLTRRLVDVAQDIVVTGEDCKTKNGILVTLEDAKEINKTLAQRLLGRTLLRDLKNKSGKLIAKTDTILDKKLREEIEKDGFETVVVRSPITCRSLRGICQKCYGLNLGDNKEVPLGEAVGIVAAQAIGEPGTQLTMRTFHTGGVASGGDITTGLPRVEEIFEVRPPKGKAILSDVSGEVMEIVEVNREKIIKIKIMPELDEENSRLNKSKKIKGKNKKSPLAGDIKELHIPPNTGIFAEVGKIIKAGDLLSEGHADLRELLKISGSEKTQRYIIKEVQKIYSMQGASIHDKHIETIVRQMFSRVKIKEEGDTEFTPGEITEKSNFRGVNRKIKSQNRTPAKAYQMLLGITKVSLTTDSFLSSASFQETARVLIGAAIEGKKDYLRGLKENVIIGRLIPAGTGYKG